MKSKSGLSKVVELIKRSVLGFLDDNAMKFSAALSYYTLFALPPLMMLIIATTSLFFKQEEVTVFFYEHLTELVGPNTTLEIQRAMGNIDISKSSTLATWIGVGFLLFSASGVFAEIQSSINYIWGLSAKPDKGLIRFAKNRLLSFSMIVSVGFLLLVSLMINSIMSLLYGQLSSFFKEETVYLIYILNNAITFVVITFLFALIFKTLPNGKIGWKETVIGAGFTSLLFMIGKFGIGWYLSNAAAVSLYSATGSIIVLLVWVYYSAMILYFGAEFTKNYAEMYGRKIEPGAFSIAIHKE